MPQSKGVRAHACVIGLTFYSGWTEEEALSVMDELDFGVS